MDNKFNPFSNTYLEVTLPLEYKAVKALENSDYAYLLDELHNTQDYSEFRCAGVTMTVAFDFANSETFFTVSTISYFADGSRDEVGTPVDFDPKTANYFRAEAMKHILNNFNDMAKCKPAVKAVTA